MSCERGTKRLRTGDATTAVSSSSPATVARLLRDSKEEKDILRRVNSFLDAWSLFQWGRVVVRMSQCRAAAHEIGLALLDHTVLKKGGYVRMDLCALFLDQEEQVVEEPKTEEEIKYYAQCARAKEELNKQQEEGRTRYHWIEWPKVPESLKNTEPQSLGWKRRFDFLRLLPPDYSGPRNCPAVPCFLEGHWEDVLPNLSLPQRHLVFRFVRDFVEEGMYQCYNCPGYLVTLESFYLAARSSNNREIFFSKPLETRYTMRVRDWDNYKMTLRDLASMNSDWSRHRLYDEDPDFTDPDFTDHQLHAFSEQCVDKLSQEELVQDVEQLVAEGLGQTVESVRNEDVGTTEKDEINSQGSNDDQEDWDAWERADFELYNIDEEQADVGSRKRFLIEHPYTSQPPRQGIPQLSTNRTAFARAVARFDQLSITDDIHLSVSALDLAQMIMEDFAFGVAVKPFLVAREGKMPTWCYLVIGKHHGTTMAAFKTVLQFSEEALDEGSENDSDYCLSDVDSAASEEAHES